MAELSERVRAHIEAFVEELTVLVNQATLEKVAAVLETPAGASPHPATSTDRRRGSKRTSQEVEAQCAQIVAYLGRHPGQKAEAIAATLGTSPKGLTLALKKLLATRRISRQGRKRATHYFAGGAEH